jgi:hypothetical protein
MYSENTPTLVIQAAPNRLGVEFARLVLDSPNLSLLRELYDLRSSKKLVSLSTDALAVQWVKNGCIQEETITVCEVFENGLNLSSHFLGLPNAQGVFEQGTTIFGTWILGDASDLDTEALLQKANHKGEIFEEALGLSSLDQVSNAAWLQFANRRASFSEHKKLLEERSFSWPNPYTTWAQANTEQAHARRLLPSHYVATERSSVVNHVLNHLNSVATDSECDPNERCALYTLMAALIICPEEVALLHVDTKLNVPDFLLSPAQRELRRGQSSELTHDHIESHAATSQSVGVCGTCSAEFPASPLTVSLVYQNLKALLEICTNGKTSFHAMNTPQADLALLYEDHLNNRFAQRIFVDFSVVFSDDLSRLKILAFGLDALKRLLEPDYPWYEDLRAALESSDTSYQLQTEDA